MLYTVIIIVCISLLCLVLLLMDNYSCYTPVYNSYILLLPYTRFLYGYIFSTYSTTLVSTISYIIYTRRPRPARLGPYL